MGSLVYKLEIMKKLLLPFVVFLLATFSNAQATNNTAPVSWERYQMTQFKLSLMLPKLPLITPDFEPCESRSTTIYTSYAESALYEFRVTNRIKKPVCQGARIQSFGSATLNRRLAELRGKEDFLGSSKSEKDGYPVYKIETKRSTRLIIVEKDEPDWWLELAVYYYSDHKPDLDKFFNSLAPKAEGKEVGEGAVAMLGDPISDIKEDTTPPKDLSSGVPAGDGTGELKGDPYMVILQPRAKYTEIARHADTQGAVRLKITIQANGAVGSIVPVTTLRNGLTEMAIAAARSIVFLPKRVNGIPVDVVLTREYTFTIY